MNKLLLIVLSLLSFQVSAQFGNLLDTIKKGSDVIQSITSGNNQQNQTKPQQDTQNQTKPQQETQINSGGTNKVQGPPIAKSGSSVTNKNIKNVLEKFDKQFDGAEWKSQDELNVLVSVEILKNGSEKFYNFKITDPAQVPVSYSMIYFSCTIPQHFEQAIEALKAPPKTIMLKAFDWGMSGTDTEASEARRKPKYLIEATCDFDLVGK